MTASAAADPSHRIEAAELRRSLDRTLTGYLDAGPDVSPRAALAIGRTRDPAGAPALRAHLGVRDVPERAMVAYALGLLADERSAGALRSLALHDRGSAVRYAAVDALGRIAAAEGAAAPLASARDLLAVARFDRDPVVRGHAAAQLETFGTAAFAPSLAAQVERALAAERDGGVRWHLAWTIFRGYAKLADPGVLRAMLRSPDELVRVEALRALGRRGDAGAAVLVRPLLEDASWRVQLEAREALLRLAHEDPTEHLLADPPGLHLPPVDASPVEGVRDAGPRTPPAAPDPATLDLGPPLRPTTAAQMDGPLPGAHPRVLVRTTRGDVVVRLHPEWAPSTVASFLASADRGAFDGNRWFRIVPDFVDQSGDRSDGDGDPGFRLPAEENPVEQRSGVLAMGLDYRDGAPIRDSAGTQFYFTLSPQLHLDRAFGVFGEVERGMPVLARLVESDRIVEVRRLADR